MRIKLASTKKLEKKLKRKNLCIIIGLKDLIDKFCKDKGVQVDSTYGELTRIYNQTDDVVYHIYFMNKNSLINAAPTEMKIDRENLLGVKIIKTMWKDGYKNTVHIIDNNNREIDILLIAQDSMDRRDRMILI